MSNTLTENADAKGCKGALNKPANPSERLTDGGQFLLGSTEEKCRQGAVQIALMARASMRSNDFSLSTLGSMIGKDATAAHRVLDAESPSIAGQVYAAVLMLDKDRTFVRGINNLVGCDLVERPTMTDAEFRRRVEHKARQGKVNTAWLEEALEDAP